MKTDKKYSLSFEFRWHFFSWFVHIIHFREAERTMTYLKKWIRKETALSLAAIIKWFLNICGPDWTCHCWNWLFFLGAAPSRFQITFVNKTETTRRVKLGQNQNTVDYVHRAGSKDTISFKFTLCPSWVSVTYTALLPGKGKNRERQSVRKKRQAVSRGKEPVSGGKPVLV